MYSFVQDGDTFVVSLDNHQEVVAALAAFCEEQGILAGEITGIGAVNSATLRFLDPATKLYVDKTFDEQMEISSLVGNISEKDGKPYLHLHANFGRRDYTVVGGHLLCCTLNGGSQEVPLQGRPPLRAFTRHQSLRVLKGVFFKLLIYRVLWKTHRIIDYTFFVKCLFLVNYKIRQNWAT